jgi:hypothetical protein
LFAKSDLLTPNESHYVGCLPESMVVAWADPATDRCFLVPAQANSKGRSKRPEPFSYANVASWLEEGFIHRATLDLPPHFDVPDEYQSRTCVQRREERFAIIQPLLSDLEAFLVGRYGAKFVQSAAEKFSTTRDRVYQLVYLYLRRGQTRQALMPDYANSGGPPREPGNRKRGRPRQVSPGVGKNIDAVDKENVRKVIRKRYLSDRETLVDSYKHLLADFYAHGYRQDAQGRRRAHLYDEDNRPSWDQFYYHAHHVLDDLGVNADRHRGSSTDYDMNRAGRSGDRPRPEGPGHVYQLDATPYDLEMVSPVDPDANARIGRVTLYQVVDVFSAMTVGIHLSTNAPSWDGARLALFQAFRNKVELCRELGITIDESEWPCEGIPTAVCVDNAELQNRISEAAVSELGFQVIFTRAWRGDDKGLVERSLQTLLDEGAAMPGYISKRRGARGVRNPKVDAVVTPNDLHRQLVRKVLHENNAAELNPSYLSQPMVRDGVRPISRELWNWGIENRPGMKAPLRDSQIYLRLLEAGEATIQRKGIYFRGMWYASESIRAAGWQDQPQRGTRSARVAVRYMRHCVNTILVVTRNGLEPAYLQGDSERCHDLTFDQSDELLSGESRGRKQRERPRLESSIDLDRARREMLQAAKARQVRLTPVDVRKQDISANRAEAQEAENQASSARFQSCVESEFGASPGTVQPESVPEQTDQSVPDRRKDKHQKALNDLIRGKSE